MTLSVNEHGNQTSRFRPKFEQLEDRIVFSVFQNPSLPCDVDASGFVTSIDALTVIDALNTRGSGFLPIDDGEEENFLDVDGDGFLSPLDALLIVNALNRNPNPPQIVASIAPADDPNFNGVVLSPSITVIGQTSPSADVSVWSAISQTSTSITLAKGLSDSRGVYQIVVPLEFGANHLVIHTRDELGRSAEIPKTWYLGDVVADWNATMLNAVRDWTGLSNDPYPNRIVPSRPPIVTRNLAMVHLAMFDAANAVEGRYQPYLSDLPKDPNASAIVALATAAHALAITLYPDRDEIPVFDATLAASLALVPNGESKQRGIALGKTVAQKMLAARTGDGASSPAGYTPTAAVGKWNRTEPDLTPPELPQWRNLKPFAVDDVVSFRVPPPPSLDSSEYDAAVDEVMRLGKLDSTERTPDQTESAKFWADGPGTATPPGHWNRIGADVLMKSQLDLLDNARTLALLNLSMADAAIAAWDVKYHYELWRPLHAIRRADLDGNSLTVQDETWAPLLRTPAHPSYVSGHSTFSAAAAIVLTSIFGNDISFSSTTDPQSGLTQRPLAPELITTRYFSNFWDAADEAGRSRIYGGIHFSFDNTAGKSLGKSVGEAIVGSWMKPV
jgi:hypothetical protein